MTARTLLRRALFLAGFLGLVAGIVWSRKELNEPNDRTGSAIPLPRVPRGTDRIADARLVARPEEPEWVVDLAGWVPKAIRNRPLQLLAVLWAFPSTLVGLVVGLLSGARPTLRDGVVVFSPVRGPVCFALHRGGFAATTLGHVVLARHEPSDALMAHELVHTRQAERLGPLMGPVYWYLLVRYGYARHPMERAARVAGREAKHLGGGHTRPTAPPVHT